MMTKVTQFTENVPMSKTKKAAGSVQCCSLQVAEINLLVRRSINSPDRSKVPVLFPFSTPPL